MTDEPKKPEAEEERPDEEPEEALDEEALDGVQGGVLSDRLDRPLSPTKKKRAYDGLKKDPLKE